MRRVRNQNSRSNNPAVMFAAGLENIINDHLRHPSKFDEEELRIKKRKASRKEPSENLIGILCRHLFWRKPA